ncbi:MAG: stage III sporulation protein AC [Clostridiales bacterium]|nr:stage III sporulation protein AC [Clostridiales bacterium]
MQIDVIFKIASVGILVAVLNQILIKAGKDDIATLVTVTGLIIVILTVVDLVKDLFNVLRGLFGGY